jgi:2-methylcitrate dehydratase PrpD
LSHSEKASVSGQIADFVLKFRLEDVPENMMNYGKMLLVDTFGVAMSCKKMEHAVALEKTVLDMLSAPECTLWGGCEKARLADAVLYNAGLIHGADYDDTHVGGVVHPSAPVVSTAIAVGEFLGASGREIMEAIVAGWEVIVRLALAANGGFHDVGYHCTGIVAPFAAACVAAKLMKLPKIVLVNALGICGSQAAALQEFLHDGTWVKKFHPGWGAHSAIYALMAAKNGFTGPERVFEGDFGLWKTHIGRTDGFEEVLSTLGTHFHTPEITVKMYPVCHMTHSFIDAMLALREKGVTVSDIESLECRIESRCYHIVCEPREAKVHPQTDYMMRFSLPYVVAVAAACGRVSPWEIDLRYVNDPEIQDLMNRVTCISDESKRNPGHFPGWLRLTTKDGRTYTEDRRHELGSLQNPIEVKDIRAKFENNLGNFYAPEKKACIADLLGRFETLNDVSELMRNLEIVEL